LSVANSLIIVSPAASDYSGDFASGDLPGAAEGFFRFGDVW